MREDNKERRLCLAVSLKSKKKKATRFGSAPEMSLIDRMIAELW